jgi:hypothetical protein
MANYADTVLQNARAKMTEMLNEKFEGRPRHTELIEAFMQTSSLTLPNLADIREATTQTTQTMYAKKTAYTVNTGKSCSPSGEQGDSGIVNLTWNNRNVVVSISEARHDGNEYKMAEALAIELMNAEKDLFKGATGSVDAVILAYLEANRTQVCASGTLGTFDGVNFSLDYANANVADFYNYLYSDMQLNNYSGEFYDIFNTTWGAYAREQANQGEANATNTKFQYQMPFDFMGFSSNSITNAAGDLTTHYVIPAGGVAMLDWNDPKNRRGLESGDAYWDTYQSKFMPGVTLDLFKKVACSDTSASGGSVQDLVHTYELSINFALTHAPLSTANETPIFKSAVLTT